MTLPCGNSWWNALRRGLGVALLLVLTCGGSMLLGQPGANDSGLSIVRIYIPSERAAKELEKVQQGALVLLPLPDFETRVEQARKSLQASAQKPRLTKAHYSAELVDGSLRNGAGRWSLSNPGRATAILPLAPINLALRHPKWEQGGEAIVAELDGKALGLLVNPAANLVCTFDWSARGVATSEGTAFKLAVPASPISTFELTLPADCWLSVQKDAGLVTGPQEFNVASKRLWKVQVTGSRPIEILIRKIADRIGPAPTVFARVRSEQRLLADRIEVEHAFQIDVLHGGIQQLILEGDAGLQPFEVALKSGEIKTWKWTTIDQGTGAKGKTALAATGQLTIEFNHPLQATLQELQIRSLAARPTTGLWRSPSLRIPGAVPRGETLTVRVSPDVPMGQWDHGTFQPVKIATEGDGTQVITLAETANDATGSRRPTLSAPAPGLDVHASADYRWQITPRGASLAADFQFTPARGQLFELRVKLPKTFPGYQIESLEVLPPQLLRDWQLVGDSLVVELTQPLSPMMKARLKLRLQSGFRELTTGIRILAFPELEPTTATRREGSLAIDIDPVFQAQLLSSSVPLASPSDGSKDKGTTASSFRLAFRDQRLSAAIRLVPQSVQVRLRGRHGFTLAEKNARLQFRWEAEPLVGAPEYLDFRLAPGFPSSWRVLDEDGIRIHHWERLHLNEALPHLLRLGCQEAWQSAALGEFLPHGSYWRFHLSEPLRKKAKFTIEAMAPAGSERDHWRRLVLHFPGGPPWPHIAPLLAGGGLSTSSQEAIWSLPLMAPVQRANVDEHMVVESLQGPITKVEADGSLRPISQAAAAENAPIHLQAQAAAGLIDSGSRITVRTRTGAGSSSLRELCDGAKILSFVHKDGRIYHRVQFRLWHWRDRTFEIRFPADAQILAVKLHDRWLGRIDAQYGEPQVRLTLPFDQNAEFVRYEILVRGRASTRLAPGMMQIASPRIDWPIAPVDLQERWFLEGGLTPLHQELMVPVGVPARIAGETESARWLRHTWEWGQSWWPYWDHANQTQKAEEQKQTVHLAEDRLRDDVSKTMKLGEVLERFALVHLQGTAALVIDQVAFRALGLSTQTVLLPTALSPDASRPFWESLGLVYLPCPSGAVLTSPQRLQAMGIYGPLQAVELDGAVKEAVAHGQDASSGLCLVLAWLTSSADELQDFPVHPALPGSDPLGDLAAMTEWKLLAEAGDAATFVVVDPFPARIVGWLLAMLAALVLWRIERGLQARSSFRVYLFALAAGILIAIWLPIQVREFFAWPTLFVLATGFVWHLIRIASWRGGSGMGGNSSVRPVATTVAALAGAVFLLSWTYEAPAQAPAVRSYSVLIIDGAKPAALVTPELLYRLDELANQSAWGSQAVYLVSAKYTGKVQTDQAQIDVQYELHSFKDKATLVLPLTGVQLQEGVFLDGAPVFPVPHKQGYALPIRDKGAHHLRLSFSVRPAVVSGHLELLFKIPKLIQNEMTLQWPTPAQTLYCLNCAGEEKLAPGSLQAVKEWHGQLGYVDTVQLRWPNPATQPVTKAIEVKEAHFWDLRAASTALHTSLHYIIGKGGLPQISVSMPEGLHVRSVAVSLPLRLTAPSTFLPVSVKHWSIVGKGAQRRLIVDFAQPVAGAVTVNLEIVPPAFAHKPQMLLPLPAPLQGQSVSGFLGYHLESPEIRRAAQNLVAVQSISSEEFAEQWKKQTGQIAPTATRALSFQRGAPQAGLELEIEPNARQAQLRLQWNLDHHHALFNGNITFTSAQDDLILLELQVDPALTLADVAGDDVRRWQLHESLLQVWLRQPRKQTTIALTGWRSNPAKKGGPALPSWTAPGIYPLKTRLLTSTLEVHAVSSLNITAEKLKGLRPDPVEKLRFAIDFVPYEAAFRTSPRVRPPLASSLTKVQAAEGDIEVWHGVRLTSERGHLPKITLLLKGWRHEPMALNAPGAAVQAVSAASGKDAGWILTYPPGMPQDVYLTLRGRVARNGQPSLGLPNVQLSGATINDHRLAWKDMELQDSTGGRIVAPPASSKARLTASIKERWHEDLAEWNLAEAPAAPVKASLPKDTAFARVRILSTREETRLAGQPPWLHEASLWVHAPKKADLRIQFPAAVEAFSALVGERLQATWNPTAKEFVLPMEETSAPRLVKLRWKYSGKPDRLDEPIVASFFVDQTPLPAHPRVLWLPASLLFGAPELSTGPTLAPRLLQEAEGQVEVTFALTLESPRSLETAQLLALSQQQFQACVRHAEYAIAILKAVAPETDQSVWQERLNEVKRRNLALAKEGRYDEVLRSAEKLKSFAPAALPESGRAHPGVPMLVPRDLTSLPLQFASERTHLERRTFSEMTVLATLFLLVFSFFRHGGPIARAAAPEVMIGFLVAAMLIFGISMIGIATMVVMLAFRVWWLARRWRASLG